LLPFQATPPDFKNVQTVDGANRIQFKIDWKSLLNHTVSFYDVKKEHIGILGETTLTSGSLGVRLASMEVSTPLTHSLTHSLRYTHNLRLYIEMRDNHHLFSISVNVIGLHTLGHAGHMLEWFQTHNECPVSDCHCKCLFEK
jgi:hypothetical protein